MTHPSDLVTVIVARNRQAAARVARTRGLRGRQWAYVGRPVACRGFDRFVVVVGPGFWQRPDAHDIAVALRTTGSRNPDNDLSALAPPGFPITVSPLVPPGTAPLVAAREIVAPSLSEALRDGEWW